MRLPEPAEGCAVAVSDSIGHVDPGGPAWRRTRIARVGPVQLSPSSGQGRAVITIVSSFEGGREPSIEEDLVYLAQFDGGWRILKASTTFYRAIGTPEVPLSALTPP